MEAPDLAVIGLLKTLLTSPGSNFVFEDLLRSSPGIIASLTEQLECFLSKEIARNRPAKFGVPSEGPWRNAVRQQLSHCCPAALDILDKEARRARAVPIESALFPNPACDIGHSHLRDYERDNPGQTPSEPELLASGMDVPRPFRIPSQRLLDLYLSELDSVREKIVRAPASDCLSGIRRPLYVLKELGRFPTRSEAEDAAKIFRDEIREYGHHSSRSIGRYGKVVGITERPAPSIDDMIASINRLSRSRDHDGISRSV
jgi:hypothetical protein